MVVVCSIFQGFFFSYLTFQECSLYGYLHSTNLYNSHIDFLRFNLSQRRQREIARGITQEQSRRMRRRKRLELKVKYEDTKVSIALIIPYADDSVVLSSACPRYSNVFLFLTFF